VKSPHRAPYLDRANAWHVFCSDNDVLQARLLHVEESREQERQKLLAPKQRTRDFDSDPPNETAPEDTRKNAGLTTEVFQIVGKVLSLSPERVSSIQSGHPVDRPPVPHFLFSDHHYYIYRDGDPCLTPFLLSLLPPLVVQPHLLNIVKDVFVLQPLGSHSDLVRRVNTLRNPDPAAQKTNEPSGLKGLGLYAIVAGAFALAAVGSPASPSPILSSIQAITLYSAGRRALQLVTDHPQFSPNSVDHLWAAMLLLQFLLFSHRLTGGEQPHSGAWHRAWVRPEIVLMLKIIVRACEDHQGDQSLQQPIPPDVGPRDLLERAKLASVAYYYEM
jgi:hypothetical protein